MIFGKILKAWWMMMEIWSFLDSLEKAVLSLSYGNDVPERGLSLNKYTLSIHGNNLQDEIIVALRIVNDKGQRPKQNIWYN